MKALVVNALASGFELEDIDITTPIGREVLIDVQASGLCHTDLLFATHDIEIHDCFAKVRRPRQTNLPDRDLAEP